MDSKPDELTIPKEHHRCWQCTYYVAKFTQITASYRRGACLKFKVGRNELSIPKTDDCYQLGLHQEEVEYFLNEINADKV
jgi:hypothetical protein